MTERRIHPAWIAAIVTFFTLIATSGFRAAPSVLIVPLQNSFGWSRASISTAISINVLAAEMCFRAPGWKLKRILKAESEYRIILHSR